MEVDHGAARSPLPTMCRARNSNKEASFHEERHNPTAHCPFFTSDTVQDLRCAVEKKIEAPETKLSGIVRPWC